MSQITVVITGASSGLGLAFVKHYASLSSVSAILAFDISPFPRTQFSHAKLLFHQIDITSPDAFSGIGIRATTPIHLVIHCAGVRGLVPQIVAIQPGNVAAAETLEVMDHTTMLRTFEINVWGTFHLVQTILPNLQQAAKGGASAKVVILSSRMGSIAANTAGGG